MKHTKLGRTGLDVSRLCLGCMSYGVPERGSHPWTLGESESRPFIRKALDLGINFFDTANVYSDGTSEEIVGRALLEFASRDEVVIATKVHGRMHKGPNGAGLSRKAIMAEIDASLKRLGTDHVDLYQIHRWDHVDADRGDAGGAARRRQGRQGAHIGASSMHAWQFAKALHVAERHGWTRFSTMQNYLNLLYREEEREMLPLCRDEGIGVIPWSPLARGRLTREWDATSARSETDAFGRTLYADTAEADRKVVEAVGAVAARLGVPRAQVALAWVLQKSEVSAPIVGATRLEQLDDAVAALDAAARARGRRRARGAVRAARRGRALVGKFPAPAGPAARHNDGAPKRWRPA